MPEMEARFFDILVRVELVPSPPALIGGLERDLDFESVKGEGGRPW